MSSTNKTTNYELSQFLGTDKPAWLSDYNTDMSKIDAQMKLNADGVTTATGSATTANASIGTLASLTTTAKTDLVSAINEVDSNADTAAGTANTAATNANSALSGVTGLTAYLNLGVNNTTLTKTDMSLSGVGTIVNNTQIKIIGNNDNSLIKIYGNIPVTNVQDGSQISITISNTGLTPLENINITGGAIVTHDATNPARVTAVDPLTYTINQNGTITLSVTPYGGATSVSVKFLACVIFIKNFGD